MTIPTSDIKTALFSFVEAATGLANNKIVFAHQNKPDPETSYLSIIPILSIKSGAGGAEIIYPGDGTIEVIHDRDIVAQITYFGPGAMTVVSSILDAIEHPVKSMVFGDANLSVRNDAQITNLTAPKGLSYEDQANIDLRIMARYSDGIVDDLDWFNIVEYCGEGDLADKIPLTRINL